MQKANNKNIRGCPEKALSSAYYKEPVENIAIGNIMWEEKQKELEQKLALTPILLEDMKAVLKRAKEMNCETVNFYRIPVKNVELVIDALQSYKKTKVMEVSSS